MTTETANEINSACCRIWLCLHVTGKMPQGVDVCLVRQLSLGQLQTAADVVEAGNEEAMRTSGPKSIQCVIAAECMEAFKARVDLLAIV